VLKPEAVQQQPAQTASPTATAATPSRAGSAQTATASAAGPASTLVASTIPQPRPQPAPAAPPALTEPAQASVPAGYKLYPFQYCSSSQKCWDASVLVPSNAQLVSSDCQRAVFEAKAQATTVLLLAGLAKSECDGHGAAGPSLVRWKQLADPENDRAPGTYSTISSQTTKLSGKPAIITTLGFRTGMTQWMGKRIEVESNGVPLVVGCLAERDHFDDGDAVCSMLIGSLQLP